jgi:hypothetical protein
MTRIKEDSIIQRTLRVVKEDPGVNANHIAEQLGDVTTEQVSFSLAHLRRTKQIENRGKAARGASWYAIEELTFDMLHDRKPKRGTCVRCRINPTQGLLVIQVLNTKSTKTGALVSLTTSMCLECIEYTYRQLAAFLVQPAIFGDECPKCRRDRPVIGRVMLGARQYTGGRSKSHNPVHKSIANSTYKYCEHCTVETYRETVDKRDELLEERIDKVTPITG